MLTAILSILLRRFSCSRYRTWPCLPLSSRVSLLLELLLRRDVSPHNYQPVRSFAITNTLLVIFSRVGPFAPIAGFLLFLETATHQSLALQMFNEIDINSTSCDK